MGKVAVLFPGQGAQSADMVTPFAEAWPAVAEAIDRVAGPDLRSLLSGTEGARLRETANTQPAVLATGWSVSVGLRAQTDLAPDILAGHSLGYLTAATAANVLAPAEAVSLASERGRLMARAEREAGPGTMIAVSLVPPAEVVSVLEDHDRVSIAGYNTPEQTVISGPSGAVRSAAEEISGQLDRARTTELDVGSAFHSPVMEPATDPFESVLAEPTFRAPAVPLVSDVTGQVRTDPDAIAADFLAQLTSPTRWTDVLATLLDWGVTEAVVVPPAGPLAALTERTSPELDVVALEAPADVESIPFGG